MPVVRSVLIARRSSLCPKPPASRAADALRREAAPHRVLRDRARLQELQQVVGPARLVADAGQRQAAEGVAADDGAGGLAVDVKVARRGTPAAPSRCCAGCASRGRRSARYSESSASSSASSKRLDVEDAEHRAEDLLARQRVVARRHRRRRWARRRSPRPPAASPGRAAAPSSCPFAM